MNRATRYAAKLLRALPSYDRSDRQANVTDALTNLRHYCDHHKLDFYVATGSSYQHYLAERGWK